MESPVVEAVVAGKCRAGGDDALGEVCECLCGLEGGAWGILSHDASVEEGLPGVLREPAVHLSTVAPHELSGVVGGRRHHGEHLSRAGVECNDAAYLSLQETFAECLEVDVDAERQVLSRHGLLVELSVLVASLDSAVGIAEHNLHALLSAQLLLVGLLHAELSLVVAGLVVGVLLHVAL